MIRGSFCRKAARRRVARGLAKGRLAFGDKPLVEAVKSSLAKKTSPRTRAAEGSPCLKTIRDAAQGPDVGSDVLSPVRPSPRCRCPLKDAVAVHQCHSQTVDLQLAKVASSIPNLLGLTCRPGTQLLVGEDVVQAHQAFKVINGGEVSREPLVDLLGRAVGRPQTR